MSVQTFWSESRWGRRFGVWGPDYTIVRSLSGGGYHIGLDMQSSGDIPCLVAGVIVAVEWTGAMGYCVEIDTGRAQGRYFSYCHIANDRLPRVGQRIEVGGRVGRTAYGPRGISTSSVEYPGTAWRGIHCHLVISNILHAAWTLVRGRKLADFYDPAPIIRSVLAAPAGGGATPFNPQEDDMTAQDSANIVSIMAALGAGGLTPENEPSVTTIVKMVADIKSQVNGLPDALAAIMGQVNGVPTVLAEIKAAAGKPGGVDVQALAKAIVDAGVGPAVAVELSKRLAS